MARGAISKDNDPDQEPLPVPDRNGSGRKDAARTGWTSTLWDMADQDCLSTLVLSECWGADGAQLVRQPRGDHRFWPFEVVAQPQMARILDLDRARAGR